MRRRDFPTGVSATVLLTACGSKTAPPMPPGTLSAANNALGQRPASADFRAGLTHNLTNA